MKTCKGPCGERYPEDDFPVAVRWPSGKPRYYGSRCRACKRLVDRERHAMRRRDPEARRQILEADRRWQHDRYWRDPEKRAERLARQRQRQRRDDGTERPYRWRENQAHLPTHAPLVSMAPLLAWMNQRGVSRLLVLERGVTSEYEYVKAYRSGLISIDDADRILCSFDSPETIGDLYSEALAA